MKREFWLLLFILNYEFCFVKSEELASFFGNSYISVPLQEAYASNNIQFSFRTWLPDALFLLVAGRTDFCIVQLESGVIKVRINLGAGEEELSSPTDIKLNDGDWHQVKIIRREANLTLDIDKIHTIRKHLPGEFFELNIQFGVYVGGDGHFKEQFLGHLVGLRGCLANLMYGNMNLLQMARQRQSNSKVHGITWNCASEFDATANTELSFIEDNAYIQLIHSTGRAGARWQFDLKTVINNSIILYNNGPNTNGHTIAIEIISGHISMLFNNKNGVVCKVMNKVFIADNSWHKIIAQYNPYQLELTVDTTMESTKILSTKYLDLSDSFYLGGLELTKRTRALIYGIGTAELNFIGCLKGLAVNGEPLGLSNAVSTFGIKSNICLTDDNLTNKSATELEIIGTEAINVNESKSVQLTANNIKLIVDYPRWGLRDNMIHFYIIQLNFGKIHINNNNNNQEATNRKFTLIDLNSGKVEYVHDGSETLKDTIQMEMRLSDLSTLPKYLHQSYLFNVTVNVLPQNDPPIIIAPALLRMAKGTRKIITSEVLNVTDVDTESTKIAYYVVKSYKYSKTGQIERVKQPNKSIQTFTQADIDNNQIVFACTLDCTNSADENISEIIILNVTDGKSPFQTLAFKIILYDLQLFIKHNKGIYAVHNSTALIQSKDLEFTSNLVDDSDFGIGLNNVRIDVVETPQYGILECKHGDDKYWNVCDWFMTSDIFEKHVRYKHTSQSQPQFDDFKFRASINKMHTSTVYNFTITFIKLKLEQLHLNAINLNGTLNHQITIDHIQYQTIPILASNKNIQFVLMKPPKYGSIYLNNNHLQTGDSWTQLDIDREYLNYKITVPTYSKLNDSITFVVSSKNCEHVEGTLNIMYEPNASLLQHANIVIQPVQVIEGEKVNIPAAYLSIEIQGVKNLYYNITDKPKFGVVQKCRHCGAADIKYCLKAAYDECLNISEFTSEQLHDGLIYYSHDNSETRDDCFEFKATSINHHFQFIGNFSLNIILKNDNAPKRIHDKVLQVVEEQTKLITGDDLMYTDADINTTPNDIIFTCQSISNGVLYNILRPNEKINTFTQGDLNNKLILFKHHGEQYGKIILWITDGQFYENGILEIYASKPFITIVTPNQLICKRDSQVQLTGEHIQLETNLNVIGKNVIYRILKPPKCGYFKFNLNSEIVRFFDNNDLLAGRVVYVQNKSESNLVYDQFTLRVTCDTTFAETKINIKILSAIYWQPLTIQSLNQSLFVEESTSATITKQYLEVSHTEIPSTEIIYHIKQPPKHGYLQHKSTSPQQQLTEFNQNAINTNQLQYIQNVANQTSDRIVFDVTNGISWLHNLQFNIDIIPEHFYLKSKALNVSEGGAVVITKMQLEIVTGYYRDKVYQYSLTRLPNYGSIQIGHGREFVRKFSERDLNKGLVKYVHDNSENFIDYLELIAHTGTKESEPVGIHINIEPINDQIPIVVNNTGLIMWNGGNEMISNYNLSASDGDLPPDQITYRITGNWWGSVVLKHNYSVPITTFTQQQLNAGIIYFNHTNGTMAKFMFRLTDQIHTTKEYIFTIETKPVTVQLLNNHAIHVFPFNHQLITNDQLLAQASDVHRNINYKIVAGPQLGRIVRRMDNGHFYSTSVNQFNQIDIDSKRIYYEHTHPFDGLYANDSFLFNLNGYLLPSIVMQKFNIDISVSSDDLNTYIPIQRIRVDEGGSAPITLNITQVVQFLEMRANLHAPIIYATVWSSPFPKHGHIHVGTADSGTTPNQTTFTQAQLESSAIKYQHDHSDSLNDTVRFTLYLLPDYITLCTVNIPVDIQPINDQPFQLITQSPKLNVVFGENATITKELLLTEDADTPPNQLEYGIINQLKEGNIYLLPDTVYPVNKFTQQDINDERVIYKHSGSNTTVSFHFRVWDGKFKPIYRVFNIEVIPVHIQLHTHSPIYNQQGLNVATITTQHISVVTNVNPTRIVYNLTQSPQFGTIYVRDQPQQSFTHIDLTQSFVMYMQANMTAANDSFAVIAHVPHVAHSNTIQVHMLVQPLMQRGNFTAVIGKQNRLDLNVLDAGALAELTGSNPTYRIVRRPTFGTLHKIIRSSGDRKIVYDQEVDMFTHEEIRSGVIYYILPSEQSLNNIDDLFKFILFGNIFFQPAYGEMKIRIVSDRIEPELKRHRGGMHLASPNISSDYLPIVIMVLGVLLLGVSVIIIIKCRSIDLIKEDPSASIHNHHLHHLHHLHHPHQMLQPIPLPRPPDHLMTSTTNLKSPPPPPPPPGLLNEDIPLAATAHISLPHCKVTPLGPTESSLTSSDLDIRSRYPYGSIEDGGGGGGGTIIEDWCSHDTPQSADSQQPAPQQQPLINAANPLLRRNQYWV